MGESTMQRVTVGAATAVGRVREHNEDAHLVRDGLYAVADGMGGHAAGEVASALAIETLAALAERGPFTAEDLLRTLAEANASILEAARADPGRGGMGTTVSGLAWVSGPVPGAWVVFNIGDSRVYRVVEGELVQVTTDHSEVQELVDAGLITSLEAAIHPARNIITRSLGLERDPQPDTWVIEAREQETFVICSDGLTNEVRDDQIAPHRQHRRRPPDRGRSAVRAGGGARWPRQHHRPRGASRVIATARLRSG